jgi:hypothetical protein
VAGTHKTRLSLITNIYYKKTMLNKNNFFHHYLS